MKGRGCPSDGQERVNACLRVALTIGVGIDTDGGSMNKMCIK